MPESLFTLLTWGTFYAAWSLSSFALASPFVQTSPPAEIAWDFFRGARYDGHVAATGIADSWPTQGPPVLWNRSLGQGYSSFVGRGERVFTQYQTAASQYVVCLDAKTGATVWEYRYDWSYETAGLYPGPRSSPTLDDDKLYFTSPAGTLGCLNLADGSPAWQVDMIKRFAATKVDFGYACSPVIVDNLVLLPVGGKAAAIVAFDKRTGATVWQAGDYEVSYASILPIQRNGKSLLIGYLKNDLIVLEAATGKVLAELSLSQGYDEHSVWPVYFEPYLWISAPFREGSRLLKLSDSEPVALTEVWRSELMSNDVCSSLLLNGHLYGFDIFDVQSKVHRPSRGTFRCLEFETGKSKWENGSPRERHSFDPARSTAAADSVGHSSVIFADGKLILFNDMGELILIRATPERFEQMARIRVLGGEVCWTQPMLLGKRLYLRNQSQAVCLYLGDPAELAQIPGGAMTVESIPQAFRIDLAAIVFSVEPEYAMDAPTIQWLVNWYWIMLVVGWGFAFPLSMIMTLVLRCRLNCRRFFYYPLAIGSGIVGTTIISRWMGDFIFTWPLVLGIVFEFLVYQTKSRPTATREIDPDKRSTPKASSASRGENHPTIQTLSPRSKERQSLAESNVWLGRLAILLFLSTCFAYFYLCRKLSLAFEWSFLIGFPAAIPCLLAGRAFGNQATGRGIVCEWLLTAAAFTAFYWTGAGIILWKY